MGLLDSLLGGSGGTSSAAQQLLQRFEQGQGVSDEEASSHYQEVAQQLPPDHYREAAEQALAKLSPEDRSALLAHLQGQARQQDVNLPGLHDAPQSAEPGPLAGVLASMHQQQPGILQQLLGGGSQGTFSSPVAKAALMGIAAFGMRKLMGGGPRW